MIVKVCVLNDDLGWQTKSMYYHNCAADVQSGDYSLVEGADAYHKPGL